MFDSIFDKLNIDHFSKSLDLSAARQRSIAENIANIATPGYRAKDVDFSELLKKETAKTDIQGNVTDERHIAIGKSTGNSDISMIEEKSQILKSGENNVDVDVEMVKSAENQLYYSAVSKTIAGKFRALHSAIRGKS